MLKDFDLLYEAATNEERLQLVGLLIRKVEFNGWDQPRTIELHDLPSLAPVGTKTRTTQLRRRDSNPRPGG